MKTAVASPDDGAPKKKYGIPEKDKKGLNKKQDYKSMHERHEVTPKTKPKGTSPESNSDKYKNNKDHNKSMGHVAPKHTQTPKPKGTSPSPSQDNMHKNAAKKVDSIVHMKGYIVKPMKARKKEDLEKAKGKSPSTSKGKKK
jgi:hypothetical protein